MLSAQMLKQPAKPIAISRRKKCSRAQDQLLWTWFPATALSVSLILSLLVERNSAGTRGEAEGGRTGLKTRGTRSSPPRSTRCYTVREFGGPSQSTARRMPLRCQTSRMCSARNHTHVYPLTHTFTHARAGRLPARARLQARLLGSFNGRLDLGDRLGAAHARAHASACVRREHSLHAGTHGARRRRPGRHGPTMR